MVAVLEHHGIAYFGVHKAAGTSIKHALYRIAEGRDWTGEGRLHPLFPTVPVTEEDFRRCKDLWCFAVIRDPIKRFLSAYQNRVHDHGDLADDGKVKGGRQPRWRKMLGLGAVPAFPGFDPKPDIESLIRDYDAYCKVSHSIYIHTCPASVFLGTDMGYFDAVYTTSQLGQLASDLSDRLGVPVSFPKANESGSPAPRFDDLSPAAQSFLLHHTQSDYALFKDHFTQPVI